MLRQILIVSVLNFKSLRGRFWQSMVIVVGLAATIGVMLSMLSLSTGMRQAYLNAGDPGRAIVVSKGADQEGQSAITRAMAPLIADAPGHRQGQERQAAWRIAASTWACRSCARTAARATPPCAAWDR